MEPGPSCIPIYDETFNRNKDGTASKKRLHKGNIPTLPQNKLCPHCPAKFTRSTHLNRHLRTHSNQKYHECDRCHAQFTRKDLLTRHQRSCDSSGVRSRRKSCLACAESKQKCDTGRPCTRCKARGRECVYVTDRSPSANTNDSSPGASPGETDASDGKMRYAIPETLVNGFPNLSLHDSSFDAAFTPHVAGSSSDGTPISSPSQLNDPTLDILSSKEGSPVAPAPLSNHVFDTFLSNIFASARNVLDQSSAQNQMLVSSDHTGVPGKSEVDPYDSQDGFPYFVTNIDLQPFLASTIAEPLPDFPMYTNVYPTASISHPSTPPMQEDIALSTPSETELQYYLFLFFSAFLTQMPLIHAPTWTMDRKPPILISAMQACGALYVKTRSANNFITSTLASARDTLIGEFTRRPCDPNDHVYLILAVVLLQNIGLFHQNREQRASSTIYHGMLIMMIRKSGLMMKVGAWNPPNLALLSPDQLELAWKEWANVEVAKRALSLSFLHDCCHCIFFALPPSLHPSEFNVPLPCETSLWKASTAHEWLMALSDDTLARGTSTVDRIKGVRLQELFAQFKSPSPIVKPRVLSPLAHFVVIHAITTQVNHLGVRNPHGVTLDRAEPGDRTSADATTDNEIRGVIVELQYALHNWLQSWLICPDAAQSTDNLPFMSNALPFYWVAQVSLIAYQKGLPPFGPAFTMKGEEKFKLMKEWLRFIRGFLKRGEQSATLFLDELMKIRLRNWQAEMEGGGDRDDHDDGLLGFFPEN